MFPGPDDIPVTIDCPALANTGVDALVPLIFGLVVVALGIALFAMSRGRLRRSGLALGLVLLLGGASFAVAPVSSAQADDCTPLDYAIDGWINTEGAVNTGTVVTITFWITDVVDRDGTTPIAVTIPKNALNITAGSLDPSSTNWTFDDASDPANYVFTYTGPLPKGTMSSDALFQFTAANGNIQDAELQIPVTIVTGSGGDTNTSNNTVVLDLAIHGIPG